MERKKLIGVAALGAALCCGLLSAARRNSQSASDTPSPLLHSVRKSSSDLEVTGLIRGVPSSSRHFISYDDLLKLPQVETTILNDENFTELKAPSVKVSGIYLTSLARSIGVLPQSDIIDALCTDLYRSHFPASYIAAHQPILVLTIEGKPSAHWATQTNNEDPGPYIISHSEFKPAFHVGSYEEIPQVPSNAVLIDFDTQHNVYGSITPPGQYAPGSPVENGFAIARQDCLRCHNSGIYGGTKAHISWSTLAKSAHDNPTRFAQYTRDPRSVDPKSTMPSNLRFGKDTLASLTAYYQAIPSE
jgi:hypothetical protein